MALSMNNDHIHFATVKMKLITVIINLALFLRNANINLALFFAKPPNKIPADSDGWRIRENFQ